MMIITAGMATSLACYSLILAITQDDISIHPQTVKRYGIALSALFFALCGPILFLKLSNPESLDRLEDFNFVRRLFDWSIALLWSGVLGFVATDLSGLPFAS